MARPSPLSFLVKHSGRAAGLTLGGVVLTVNGDGALVERQLAGGSWPARGAAGYWAGGACPAAAVCGVLDRV